MVLAWQLGLRPRSMCVTAWGAASSTGLAAARLALLGLGGGSSAFGLGIRTWKFGFRPRLCDWQVDLRPMRVGVEASPMPYSVRHGSAAFALEVSACLAAYGMGGRVRTGFRAFKIEFNSAGGARIL